jgi:hypothetical protein
MLLIPTARCGKARSTQLTRLATRFTILDPVFDEFSRTNEIKQLVSDLGIENPLLLQSMYIFKQPRIGGEVTCHQDATFFTPNRSGWRDSGSRWRTRRLRMDVFGPFLAGTGWD